MGTIFLLFALPWYLMVPWFAFIIGLIWLLLISNSNDSEEAGIVALFLFFVIGNILLFASGGLGTFWHSIADNPGRSFVYTLIYLVIGFSYSLLRYYLMVGDAAKGYVNNICWREDYKKDKEKGLSIAAGTYTDYLYANGLLPTFTRSKMKITNWIVWWPISLPLYFISDYIYRIFRNLLTPFKFIYEGLARYATRASKRTVYGNHWKENQGMRRGGRCDPPFLFQIQNKKRGWVFPSLSLRRCRSIRPSAHPASDGSPIPRRTARPWCSRPARWPS